MPKKGQQENIFFIHSTKANYPSLNEKKLSLFSFLRYLGNETYTFYHLYTLQFEEKNIKYNIKYIFL